LAIIERYPSQIPPWKLLYKIGPLFVDVAFRSLLVVAPATYILLLDGLSDNTKLASSPVPPRNDENKIVFKSLLTFITTPSC
jgi:hypothetical protein